MIVLLMAETSAILRAQSDMWPGSYEVALEVKDQQGVACPELQKVKVKVWICKLGAPVIGLIILVVLTLLCEYDMAFIPMIKFIPTGSND